MKKKMEKNKIIFSCILVFIVLVGAFTYISNTGIQNSKIQYGADKSSNIKQASMLFIENFVNDGIDLYKQGGIDALLGDDYEAYLTGSGGTYLFIIDKEQDLVTFNPAHPQLIGTVASEIKDSFGKNIVRDIHYKQVNAEGVWIKFNFIDPFDLKEKGKDAFVKLVDGTLIFGAGIYVGNKN